MSRDRMATHGQEESHHEVNLPIPDEDAPRDSYFLKHIDIGSPGQSGDCKRTSNCSPLASHARRPDCKRCRDTPLHQVNENTAKKVHHRDRSNITNSISNCTSFCPSSLANCINIAIMEPALHLNYTFGHGKTKIQLSGCRIFFAGYRI